MIYAMHVDRARDKRWNAWFQQNYAAGQKSHALLGKIVFNHAASNTAAVAANSPFLSLMHVHNEQQAVLKMQV